MTTLSQTAPIPATITPSRRKTRRMVLFGVLTLILFLIVSGALVVTRLGWDTATLTQSFYARHEPVTSFEEISFPSRGRDYTVYAYLLRGAPGRPVLINIHGYRGSRFSEINLNRASQMRALGYSVLSLDLADNGGQTRQDDRISFGDGERFDVLGAFDYLVAHGFAPGRIGLTGESMGASTALLAAQSEPQIRAIWSDSPYSDAVQVIREQSAGYGFPPFIVDTAMLWGQLLTSDDPARAIPLNGGTVLHAANQAVYLTTCTTDVIVLPHHTRDLAARFTQDQVNVTLWEVPCEYHTGARLYDPVEYYKRLDAFFTLYLGQPAS